MGAVAYDPKVVTIWNGFREYFMRNGLDFDYVLFSNYERQVEAHFDGMIHVAWNSPLAWLQAQRLAQQTNRHAVAVMMRDSDCDLTSVIVTRSDAGIASVTDLRGRRVAVGAKDSPQATLIPLHMLALAGLEAHDDFEVVPFDVLVGLHGDHVGGERDAARALAGGAAEAACMLEANYAMFQQEGTLTAGATKVLLRTPLYDHCNFTVLDGAPTKDIARFCELLQDMRYDDPELRPLLDMEGLKEWKVGRLRGYSALEAAVDHFGTIEEFLESAGARCR
ncbi:MAG: PhnD/SsuA/transferrin family substrate-binding protein [bacterium]|nr:PhnD/SsuA/transferrin family substrate-binding protein [bacterium]MBK8127683.1 PhnD/SsuA/transferrin family substrate-binding protein [bacterium]